MIQSWEDSKKWMDLSNWKDESIPTLNQRTGHRESIYKSIKNHFPHISIYIRALGTIFSCIFRWNNFHSTWRDAAAEKWVSRSFLCHDWDSHFSVLFWWQYVLENTRQLPKDTGEWRSGQPEVRVTGAWMRMPSFKQGLSVFELLAYPRQGGWKPLQPDIVGHSFHPSTGDQ